MSRTARPTPRTSSRWLVGSGKVVLSSTLAQAPWERTTIVDKPAAEVAEDLEATEGGDIR
ncbi:hypothetical protein [Streptomyces collinus]|uniref:hypothetical protein n=1 Tax=Streptomyces collinus TaxID=42684 RepID=UPI0036EF4304